MLQKANHLTLQFLNMLCATLQLGKAFSGPKVEDSNYVKAKVVLQTTGFPVSTCCLMFTYIVGLIAASSTAGGATAEAVLMYSTAVCSNMRRG
jgi:hypothetical protein